MRARAVEQTCQVRQDAVARIYVADGPPVHPIETMRRAPAEPILNRYGHLRTLPARPRQLYSARHCLVGVGSHPITEVHRRYQEDEQCLGS